MPFIGTDGTVVGVIQLINKETGPFDDDDIDVMTMFASMAAPIVQVLLPPLIVPFLYSNDPAVFGYHAAELSAVPERRHEARGRIWHRVQWKARVVWAWRLNPTQFWCSSHQSFEQPSRD